MKKVINVMVVVFLIMVFTVGCGNGSGSKNEEFLGKYASAAGGSMEFLPDSQIKVDFSKDNVWLVNAGTNNHKVYDYNFLNDKRKIVSYDKATYLSIINMHPCKISKNKIILHPGSSYEAVFEKGAD